MTKDELYEQLLEATGSPEIAEAKLGIEWFQYQLDQGIDEFETDHFKSLYNTKPAPSTSS